MYDWVPFDVSILLIPHVRPFILDLHRDTKTTVNIHVVMSYHR